MSGLENDVLVAKNVNFDFTSNPPHTGIVTADGQLLIGSTANPNIAMVANTLTAGTGISIANAPGSITISNTGSLTDLHTAKWIVNPLANAGGNATTITQALALASSGDTIFIMPGNTGIYTENLTLKAGVNLVSFTGDGNTPTVTIVGKLSFSSAGTVTISNIRLQTNSDNFLAVTGSAASIVNLNNCYLNCTNNTGISFTSSSSSAAINMNDCQGNLTTTGIAYFASSSAGGIVFRYCDLSNTGASTTANTISAGNLNYRWSNINNPTTTSGTAGIGIFYSNLDTTLQNVTSLTIGGSGTNQAFKSSFSAGTASAISISQTLPLFDCVVNSSNTNAVTGAGTISYTTLTFGSSSNTINTTTQNSLTTRNGVTRSTLQPCFFAFRSSTVSNVTGDGTTYTVLFDSTQFDQTSSYNAATGIYTFPVAGKYLITSTLLLTGLTASHTSGDIALSLTGTSIDGTRANYGAMRDSSNNLTVHVSSIVTVSASDTVKVNLIVQGGTKVVSVFGQAYALGALSNFSAYLLC